MKNVLYLIPDRDLIEAARLAAERLRDRLADLCAEGWELYTDSVGGVHAGLVCPACGASWVPGHVCAGSVAS